MSESIVKVRDLDHLRSVWKLIFVSKSPYEDPFQSGVEQRMVFFPTYRFRLTERQYAAVVEASKLEGESGFYASHVEYTGDFLGVGDNWYCRFPAYCKYDRIPLAIENALYSEVGKWGLIISQDEHAIVGGTKEFIRHVKVNYTEWEEDWNRLKKEWLFHKQGAWIKTLIDKLG
jgi:hypothetical protein